MQTVCPLVNGSRLQTLLGAVGIVLIGALAVRVLVGAPSPLFSKGGIRVGVAFSRLANLNAGAPVKVGESTVGFVESIQWRPLENRIWVTLRIDARFAGRIPSKSRVYQDGVTPLGRRHIVLEPPLDAAQEPGQPIADGDELRGEDPFPVEKLQSMLSLAGRRFERLLQEAALELPTVWKRFLELHGPWMHKELKPRLASLAARAAEMEPLGPWAKAVQESIPDVPPSLERHMRRMAALAEKLQAFVQEIERISGSWKDPRLQAGLQQLRTSGRTLQELVPELQAQAKILERNMAAEAGTLHAFMRDPSMYNDLRQMARRLKNAPLDLLLKRTERRDTPPPLPNRPK